MKQVKFIILLVFIFILSSCGFSNNKQEAIDSDSPAEKEEVTTTEFEDASNANDSDDQIETVKKWYFIGQDLAGNEISSKDLFASADLSLVNIWATYCGPCRVELPDLALISQNYADKNVKVLGIAADVDHAFPETIDLAEEILQESGVEYTNFTYNEQINEKILFKIHAVPTSILVDSNGDTVGEPLIGTKSYDEFSYYIDLALEDIE